MSEGKLVKMEKDYSKEVDQLLTQVQPLVQVLSTIACYVTIFINLLF
jgi:hypothetical protein